MEEYSSNCVTCDIEETSVKIFVNVFCLKGMETFSLDYIVL